jgi:hypothetical protein
MLPLPDGAKPKYPWQAPIYLPDLSAAGRGRQWPFTLSNIHQDEKKNDGEIP